MLRQFRNVDLYEPGEFRLVRFCLFFNSMK